MSGPSRAAVDAAMGAKSKPGGRYNGKAVEVISAAMHDPALGLDRSVCLRDVVEFMRDHPENFGTAFEDNVESAIVHKFGGGA